MVTGKSTPARRMTLRQAQALLTPLWPGLNAPVSAHVAYHERAARLYQHVARVDLDHHHEALYLAGYERDQVERLRACIGAAGGEKGGSS